MPQGVNKYFSRSIDHHLSTWKDDSKHKPLLLRGARQVGKSSAVRHLGESFEYFLEVNFERNVNIAELFKVSLNPKEICAKLSAIFGVPIEPGKTLLFFDEIQSCLPAIASLRFFYEEYPELHIIAAGSLLEFALLEIPSFGVGRIRFGLNHADHFWIHLLVPAHDVRHAPRGPSAVGELLPPKHGDRRFALFLGNKIRHEAR